MTIAPSPSTEPVASPMPEPVPAPLAGTSLAAVRTGVATLAHTGVDFLSFVTIAIMPALAVRLDMSEKQKAGLIAVGALASGGIQPIAAWLADRHDSRMLAVIGVLLAGVCVPMVGFAPTFPVLALLFALGALGIGAFHPPVAAAIGELSGRKRSLGVAVFFVAGMSGGVGGNVITPYYVDAFGFPALAWLAIPALMMAGAVAWAIARVPHRAHDAHDHHRALSKADRSKRWGAVGLLYAGNFVRFAVNNALVFLVIQWLERYAAGAAAPGDSAEQVAQHASNLNGPMQAAMQIGMGLTGVTAGAFLAAKWEKASLVIAPIIGAAAIVTIPHMTDHLLAGFVLTVVAGLGFGGLIPVSISLAQRLLPHRTGLASGLMMGGAWMFAGSGALVAERVFTEWGFEAAFYATGGFMLLAAGLSALLPSSVLRTLR